MRVEIDDGEERGRAQGMNIGGERSESLRLPAQASVWRCV
jgi:hypothetical protein